MKRLNWKYFAVLFIVISNFFSENPLFNLKFFSSVISPKGKFFLNQKYRPLQSELFNKLPFADEIGLVKESFLLNISDAYAPYNPSVIKHQNGIELCYRVDVLKNKKNNAYDTFIKRTFLNEKFEQVAPSETINTRSYNSEDPRIVKSGKDKFLVFNDVRGAVKIKSRIMNLMQMDLENSQPQKLDLGVNLNEKNWIPFFYDNILHFVYKINPHKILTVVNKTDPKIILSSNDAKFYDLSHWIWGEPRGGTPPIEFEDEYLSFFHSSFKRNGIWLYVMGAYTFEKKHPFNITSFSRYPIIFKELYSAPLINTADKNKRVIYPSGAFLSENKQDLVVFCGENDSAIRVMKIDPEILKLTLKSFKN